jgi:PAS domain S-box-containing protein
MPETARALQKSEEKYRALLESIDQGFCVVEVLFDADGRAADYRFLETNPGFERHTGLGNVIGRRMRELAPQHEEHWFRLYGEVALTGEPIHFENSAQALNRWYDVYAFRIGPAQDRLVGILFKDITQRRRDEEMLRETDRRKDEFIATLAHELKNPLAPLRHSIEILRHPDASLRQARAVAGTMHRQLAHLERLVDDLLHVARITSGKLELRRERVEIAQVIKDALDISREPLDAGRHEVKLDLPGAPLHMTGDAVRLAQVVANLLSNAAKYSENGSPIALSVISEGGEAVIAVKDNGIGIPPDLLPRIFDMFTQAPAGGRAMQDGLGIGLTLVKRLVEMHGGWVEARSGGPGKGSEFRVGLPLGAAKQGESAECARPDVSPTGARRVLVVDDNEDAVEALRMLLELEGHQVRTAHDGRNALAAAREFNPEVVLLDIGLPDMSGHEVARRLAEDPRHRDVTLAALTGWGQAEDRRRSAEAGFQHHLVKPVHPAELKRVLAPPMSRSSRTA